MSNRLSSYGYAQTDEATTQTCLQCYRKTVAPLLLKCQHFICLTCLKDQLMLTKGGLYNEYKCKVCGLFTDLGHLSKVFIDNQSFNMFEGEDNGPTSKDEEKLKNSTRITLANTLNQKGKSKSPTKKRVEVAATNVANLGEKADELINTLQVNNKIANEVVSHTFKEIFRSQYIDPLDYTKCIKHQKDLIFMDKETIDFYCVECITDQNLKIDTKRLVKAKRENALVKEKSKFAVAQLGITQTKIETNLRLIRENESNCRKMKQEVKQVVHTQFMGLYSDLKQLEAKYEEFVVSVLENEEKSIKDYEVAYMKLLGIVVGSKSNFNQLDNFSDVIGNICRWKRVNKEFNLNSLVDKQIRLPFDSKIQ